MKINRKFKIVSSVILLVIAAVLLFVTNNRKSIGYEENKTLCVGLNSLITLQDEDSIFLTDFILYPQKIDSVTSPSTQLSITLSDDKSIAYYVATDKLEKMTALQIWVGGVPYAVPARRSDKIDHLFTFDPHGVKYNRVQIAGQMNNWVASMSPDLQLNDEGLYEIKLHLNPGTYLYQMVLDGDQNHDPNNPNKVDNGFGKFNSIMQVDGVDEFKPHLLTDKLSRDHFSVKYDNEVTSVWAYYNNLLLDERFVSLNEEQIVISLPKESFTEKGHIRVWAVNEYGISNEILVPVHNGIVVKDAAQLTRADKYNQIIYFLLVDRFINGDKDNDKPMNRADVNPKVDYQGGDLKGVMNAVENEYFAKLGVNTLWISPVCQNPDSPYAYDAAADTKFSGYHGYWPVSSSKVDYRFGTNEELKELVEKAHNKNINILLDYVANHVHIEHPLYQQHPEYATSLYLPDGRQNIALWDEQRLTTWFDTFLPTLDYSNDEVVKVAVDSALYWFKEFGIDGFRHDACKHIDTQYWRALTRELKLYDNEGKFYQIGESYGSPELMLSYVNSGMLDGQFDFNVYDEATSAFNGVSGGTMTRLANVLNSSLSFYGAHNLMGYVSGNHDKPRFMALASGALPVGEDPQKAGWEREIGVVDSTAYDKLALFHAFNLTIPGVPVIFYGDEIGLSGGGDPDCRRMMRFDDWNNREQGLYDKVSTLCRLRTTNMALIYGDYVLLNVAQQSIAYARKYFDKQAVVFINNSNERVDYKVDLKANGLLDKHFKTLYNTEYNNDGGVITLSLLPYSAEVLY